MRFPPPIGVSVSPQAPGPSAAPERSTARSGQPSTKMESGS